MSRNLLIVESPSKAKTLKKFLGKDFEILASYGHVRSLIRKEGSVDVAHNFDMKYQIIEKNKKHIQAIIAAVQNSDSIYLATDPDREGEAISWHILEILRQERKIRPEKTIKRVVFHEITESAVKDAVQNPRNIDTNLVNAQQARSALDYLVGFNLSPLLWRKIRRGLSAGRVQSPALRLICEREKEIHTFTSQEYWSIHIDSHKQNQKFTAKLWQFNGVKLGQMSIADNAAKDQILTQLAGQTATVIQVEKKSRKRFAAAPFTTSTLQQEAVRKLGMTTDRTMRIAQQLYEGIDVGENQVIGLITYMRTDSVTLAKQAIEEIRNYIGCNFDKSYLSPRIITYKNRLKNAQEAHEAIRPTAIDRTPESLKPYLNSDQYKLYEIIWKRTLACQMHAAIFDLTRIDIAVGSAKNIFRVTGQVLIFAGFITVYQEDRDEAEEEGNIRLPVLETGEIIPVDKLYGEQHFTQPPPRYSEASLVKELEEFSIGRPSTYASIISTLKEREYVVLDKKRFLPTDTGAIVNKFLTEHFSQYVDYTFTAKLEDKLDEIASGHREWIPVLSEFWTDFSHKVEEKKELSRKEVIEEATDESCPLCSSPLVIRFGRRGRFIGCASYPDCDYTRNLNEAENTDSNPIEILQDRTCPQCNSALQIKSGPYGKFIGCASYPTCKFIEPLEKPQSTKVVCPVCKKSELLERKSRYGKIFYSCNAYPKCKYAIWNLPLAEPCPLCNWPITTLKTTKRKGAEKVCPQKECTYSQTYITE